MYDLSVTQAYFLCAVGKRGRFGAFDTRRGLCLCAAALLDLELCGSIAIEGKRIRATGMLPIHRQALRPLYDWIAVRPRTVEGLVEAYGYSITDRRLRSLFDSIGRSLDTLGLIASVERGIWGRCRYCPTERAVHRVVDMIRAELLEAGEVSDEVSALVILLDRAKVLPHYLSAFERDGLRERLHAILRTPQGRLVKGMLAYLENMIALHSGALPIFGSR